MNRVLLLILLLPSLALATPTIDHTTSQVNGTDATGHTMAFTVSSHSNRVLFCKVSIKTSAGGFTGATLVFNTSESFTLVTGSVVADDAAVNATSLWKLAAPSITTANIVSDYNAANSYLGNFICIDVYDVDQSTVNRTAATDSSDPQVATATVTATSVSGDLCIAGLTSGSADAGNDVSSFAPDSGETELADIDFDGAGGSWMAYEVAAGVSTTLAADITGTGNSTYAISATCLISASAGPAASSRYYLH